MVTLEQYLPWRSPRVGNANPERMTNPVWAWLIESKLSAYSANQQLGGPSSFGGKPAWCFERFGQTTTELSDGRTIHIAGEHEDYYDPDFYIYNDVVVRQPNGELEIFGYPHEVFPPTDFHTATVAGEQLILIGNLGYANARRPGMTQVLALDLRTYEMRDVTTSGTPPGWIHRHAATLASDGRSIDVTGGLIDRGANGVFAESFDEWRLDLLERRWHRLTERSWQSWELRRADGKPNHLWQIEYARFMLGSKHGIADAAKKDLEEAFGGLPDFALADDLFRPPVAFNELPERDDDHDRTVRIEVEGVTIRYVVSTSGLRMVVEGDLPQTTIDAAVIDLKSKLSRLERSPWVETRC